jgi:HK97 family phage major capsid protein
MPYNNVISRTDAASRIPEEVSNAMLKNLTTESAARGLFQRVPVGAAQTRFPVLSALPIAYWVTGDTGLKQTSEVNWANKYINIEELAVIVPIPENVVDDVNFDVWGEIQPLIEQAIGRALDAAVFFGTGAPGTFPTNVVAASIAAGNVVARGTNNTAAGGIVGDIGDMIGLAEDDGYDLRSGIAARSLRGLARKARNLYGVHHAENKTSAYALEIDGVDFALPIRSQCPVGL